MSSSSTLVVVGSGPGIGLATATLFASQEFNTVVLISRDNVRIQQDRESLLGSLPPNRQVQVKTFNVDITNTKAFEKVLDDVKSIGNISCVLFNAARVAPSEIFEFSEQELLRDFMTTNIALYNTAKWAVPILKVLKPEARPSFLVTSSLLWVDPFPMFFSLSLVKASQRNMVQSLAKIYPEVHFALLNIQGQVSKEDKYFNPPVIAEKFLELYSQKKEQWTVDLTLLGGE